MISIYYWATFQSERTIKLLFTILTVFILDSLSDVHPDPVPGNNDHSGPIDSGWQQNQLANAYNAIFDYGYR